MLLLSARHTPNIRSRDISLKSINGSYRARDCCAAESLFEPGVVKSRIQFFRRRRQGKKSPGTLNQVSFEEKVMLSLLLGGFHGPL